MPKKLKLKTPDWIREGYDSPAEYAKAKGINNKKKSDHRSVSPKVRNSGRKTFTIRECPKCRSNEVGVLLGRKEGSGAKEWECHKCKWMGEAIVEKELTEDELMKYLDEKGEEIA